MPNLSTIDLFLFRVGITKFNLEDIKILIKHVVRLSKILHILHIKIYDLCKIERNLYIINSFHRIFSPKIYRIKMKIFNFERNQPFF